MSVKSKRFFLGMFVPAILLLLAACPGAIADHIQVILGPDGAIISATITLRAIPPVPPDHVTHYTWDFGDGSSGMGNPISHIFATPGTYQVKVVLIVDGSQVFTFSRNIVIRAGPEAEIDVQRPAGSSISDGGADPQGNKAFGEAQIMTYTIENQGSVTLNVTGITSGSALNVTVSGISPTNFSVSAGTSSTFDVTYTPTALGAFSFELDMTSDDADEANYDITVGGTGTTPLPKIFWTNFNPDTIGRANNDGTNVDNDFIFIEPSAFPIDVAINSTHIYWHSCCALPASIGRANLDGSGVTNSLILDASGNFGGLYIDDNFIYWGTNGDNSIARANLDGSGVDTNFFSTGSYTLDVAMDDTYYYWTSPFTDLIGRARKDGTETIANFIVTGNNPNYLEIDSNFIYWSNSDDDTIGRANLDGSGIDNSFIDTGQTPIGVAVDQNFIYWANSDDNVIGRANLDGSSVDNNFIQAADQPVGVAVQQ